MPRLPLRGVKNTPLRRATEAARRREWDLAARYYREALDRKPDNPPIWVQYGHALKESGHVQEAESAYRKSLEMDPDIADTHLQLGHALKIQGYTNEAAASYLRALALDPTLHYASLELLGLGWTMAGINDWGAGNAQRVMRTGYAPARRETIEESVSVHSVVFDVSDLLHFFLGARLPTGIQRVQINVIVSLLCKQNRDFDLQIACFTADTDFWIRVPTDLFLELCDLAVCGGQLDDPAWRSVLSEVNLALVTGNHLQFRSGATLVSIGAPWGLPNYFLMIRLAKSKYGIRFIPFIHDCIPILAPEHHVKELSQDFVRWIIGILFHADKYLVNSKATAADFVAAAKLLGHTIDKPAVIQLDGEFATKVGPGADDGRQIEQNLLKRHRLDHERFVLFVATIESRKNHLMAFNVWLSLIRKRGLKQTPMLVCVGNRGWLVDAAIARLNSSESLKRKVLLLSMISDHDLSELYRQCLFTLFPSSYEGWGLPVTESLSFGKVPLITAVSSLPEAGGDYAEYFDLHSEQDLLSKVERLIDDAGYRTRREAKIKESFRPRSWADIADEIVDRVLDQESEPDKRDGEEIWAPPAQIGRYYTMSRNFETQICAGMIGGEMYRMGEGWSAPDDFGTWLKRDVADIAFLLTDGVERPCLIYLGLLGNPQGVVDYNVCIVGSNVEESGSLGPNEQRWVVLRIEAEYPSKLVHLRLVASAHCDSRDVIDQTDRHVVTLGVIGFYICREEDLFSRYRFIEALQLKRLQYLNGRLDMIGAHPQSADQAAADNLAVGARRL